MRLEQFQQKCAAVLRPELRKNKEIEHFRDSKKNGDALKEGVDLARWQQLSGRDLDPKREEFLLEHRFIERIGNSRLRCTPSGMLILDSVVADLAC